MPASPTCPHELPLPLCHPNLLPFPCLRKLKSSAPRWRLHPQRGCRRPHLSPDALQSDCQLASETEEPLLANLREHAKDLKATPSRDAFYQNDTDDRYTNEDGDIYCDECLAYGNPDNAFFCPSPVCRAFLCGACTRPRIRNCRDPCDYPSRLPLPHRNPQW